MKQTDLTGSSPFSLLFCRAVNDFQSYELVEESTFDHDALKAKLNLMSKIVYPTIRDRVDKKQNRSNIRWNNEKIITKDELRTVKTQPRYTGPFVIKRRNRGGAYILSGPDGCEYRRPPENLKWSTIRQQIMLKLIWKRCQKTRKFPC